MLGYTNRPVRCLFVALPLVAAHVPGVSLGQEPRSGACVAVADGDAAGVLRVTPASGGSDWIEFAHLNSVGHEAITGEWRRVARSERWTGIQQTIAAQRLSSGAWAIVQCELAGGRALQYSRIDRDLSSLEAPVEKWPELIDGIRLVGQEPGEHAAVLNPGNPRILERLGEVYLVGDSILYRGMTQSEECITWIAPAGPTEQTRIGGVLAQGRRIGKGGDPRIVSWNERFIVTTRTRELNTDSSWGRTVQVYKSADLQTWNSMAAPDSALEFYGYELTVAKGQLTLVGIVDTSEREKRPIRGPRQEYCPPLALVVLTYDASKGAWQAASTQPDATLTTKSEVKLIPPAVTGGALKLIRRESDNRFTTATIAE